MSDYIPLSLKYRPRLLSEVLGQEVATRTLANSIRAHRVHHAFLLFGPTGVGKTSLARVLAASLNCEKGETAEPCLKCDNCVAIMEGKSTDVIELDAASNSGIDEIRDLKEEGRYAPVNGRFKVFIIDEVHALTARAEEALLKFLEEPPAFVKLILCTTDRHKIKHTIIARCQDFRLDPLPWGMIAVHLKEICDKEKIDADVMALKGIAKLANGHMRDALQYLERAIAYSGSDPITVDVVSKALGVIDDTLYFELVEHIVGKQFADGVRTVQKILLNGNNVDAVMSGLLQHLRTLLLIKLCDSTAGLVNLTDEEKKRYLHQSQLMKAELVDDMIGYLVNVHRGLSFNVSSQVLLEQFLLKSIKSHFRLSMVSS